MPTTLLKLDDIEIFVILVVVFQTRMPVVEVHDSEQ